MTVNLVKYSEVGTLTTTQMDGNLTDIEDGLISATQAEMRNNNGTGVVTADALRGGFNVVPLADAATIAVDYDTFKYAQVTLGGNRALGNPTNFVQKGPKYIKVSGNNATARTLTFGSYYKGDIPTLADITSTKTYLLVLQPWNSTYTIITSYRAL